MVISKFEEIESWQAARHMLNLVFTATQTQLFADDLDLRRQMRRAAISAMANIAEGFDSGSDLEFRRFLRIARRSASELQSHVYVARDQNYLAPAVCDEIHAKADEVKRLIGGFIKYLSESRPRTGDWRPGTSP